MAKQFLIFPQLFFFAIKKSRIFIVCLFLTFFVKKTFANTFETIEKKRVGTSLNSVTLYKDSLFASATNNFYEEGDLFEILGETNLEHDDKNQNQRFKWFKVKTKDKKIGWLFGDALATTSHEISASDLLPFHKKRFQFNNGFENALCWIAEVNGSEAKVTSSIMNPFYKEVYLMITNEAGNSVFVNLAGESVSSEFSLKSLHIKDITADKSAEIIVEKKLFSNSSPLENRDVEVYSFQSGSFRKIFEEHLTLTDGDDMPSPSLFKMVEAGEKNIRVAYIDFVHCEDYQQNLPYDLQTKSQERCLEYVTLTYDWNEDKKQFLTLYSESRSVLQGLAKQKFNLLASPSDTAKIIGSVRPDEMLSIIKSYEVFTTSKENKIEINVWLYVKNINGELGYLPAYQVYFGDDVEHTIVLHEYFNETPVSRQDWKSEEQFLFLKNND